MCAERSRKRKAELAEAEGVCLLCYVDVCTKRALVWCILRGARVCVWCVVWCVVCGVWCGVCGAWCVVCRAWWVVGDAWCVVWCVVCGLRSVVCGA